MDKLRALLAGISVDTHSSILIEAEGRAVRIDPFSLPDAPRKADIIFVTHDHFDHFSPEDIEKVRTERTVFVMPPSTARLAAKRGWNNRVLAVAPGERGEVEGLAFEAVPAYNPGKRFHPKQNGWLGYVLTVDGLRVYIAGDTDATEDAAAVRCDVALLPIGGTYTMDAAQAAALANRMKPRAVVPIHYGTVAGSPEDFDRFAAAVNRDILVCRKL